MVLHVLDVVICHPEQSNCRTLRDHALRLLTRLRQLTDDIGQVTVVSRPQLDKQFPTGNVGILRGHHLFLLVTRKVQAALRGRAHKALMIVGCRINQVSKDLFLAPLSRSRTKGRVSIANLA